MATIDVNGQMIDFPDGLSPDQLNRAVAMAAQQTQPQQSRAMKYLKTAGDIAGSAALGPMVYQGVKGAVTNPVAMADLMPMAGGIGLPIAAGVASGGMSVPMSAGLSAVGAAGGEGYRQLVRRALGAEPAPPIANPIPFTTGNVPQIKDVPPENSNIAQQALFAGLGDLAGAGIAKGAEYTANAMRGSAVGSARRALGNTKANLTSTKSWRDALRKQATANETAETLLDAGKISKTGNTQTTLKNALQMRDQSSSGLNQVLNTADNSGGMLDTNELAVKMEEALKPKYADEKLAFKKIIDDLGAGESAPGQLSLLEAKTRIKPQLGKSWETPPSGRAVALTRRASQFLENEIAKNVKKSVGDEAAKLYKVNNKTYGKAQNALKTLAPQQAMEMGNQFPSLTATAVGAGRLAAGDIPGAIGAVGGMELLKRRGAGVTANLLNTSSKALKRISPQGTSALLKAISRKKDNQK